MLRTTSTVFASILLLVQAAVTTAAVASGDDHSPIASGSTVRLRLSEAQATGRPDGGLIEGTLVSISATDVVVVTSLAAAPTAVPRADVAGVDLRVREGRRNAGALIGAAAGAALGLIVGAAASTDAPGDLFASNPLESSGVCAALAAPVGALVGALLAPGEIWQEQRLDDIHLGGVLDDGGCLGLSVAFRF